MMIPDAICSHMKPADQCLHCAKAEISRLRGILRDMHNCIPDMPAVALQVLHTAVALGALNER